MTLEQVAERAEMSAAKISRIEHGMTGIMPRDMRRLITVYGVDQESETGQLMVGMAGESRKRGWWRQYGDAVPGWFELFVGLEGFATTEWGYDSEFVPGLLQTEGYAKTILGFSVLLGTTDDVDKRVTVRLARGKLLDGELSVWFVLNEAVIRRLVGGTEVMLGQLRHLLDISVRPNVVVQILPFSSGAHLGMGGSFSVLTFPDADHGEPQLAYVEYPTGGIGIENPEEVRHYRTMLDHLHADALSADSSRRLMVRVRDELASERT
jgi:transcriptional regulator with XRE-family HTH domain